MLKRIPFHVAVNIILTLQFLVIAFHLLVIVGIIPYSIVWGGRLGNTRDMLVFEATSILINVVLAILTAIKGGHLNWNFPIKLLNGLLWAFALLFALNTVGNLLAKATTETVIFTPITLIMAVLCSRVALHKKGA